MTEEIRPLDLSTLSTADKDRVILGLWADLRDERAKARALEQRLAEASGVGALREFARRLPAYGH